MTLLDDGRKKVASNASKPEKSDGGAGQLSQSCAAAADAIIALRYPPPRTDRAAMTETHPRQRNYPSLDLSLSPSLSCLHLFLRRLSLHTDKMQRANRNRVSKQKAYFGRNWLLARQTNGRENQEPAFLARED